MPVSLFALSKNSTSKQHQVFHTTAWHQAFFIRNKRDMINIQLKILQMKKVPQTCNILVTVGKKSEVLQICELTVDT